MGAPVAVPDGPGQYKIWYGDEWVGTVRKSGTGQKSSAWWAYDRADRHVDIGRPTVLRAAELLHVVTAAGRVALYAQEAREATAARDGAIRQMRAEGATLRAIAEAASLSHTAVANILARPS